jgi:hypothetical protein
MRARAAPPLPMSMIEHTSDLNDSTQSRSWPGLLIRLDWSRSDLYQNW